MEAGTMVALGSALASQSRTAGSAYLDRPLERITEAPLRSGNRVRLLQNGLETYDDWLAAIARARRWVHLENYIFRADTVGRRFAHALSERARAGVAVRVLVDWYGSWDTPVWFWRELRHNGVDLRFVTPIRLSSPFEAVHRDHRKVLLVDGRYGAAGGICIADQWLARAPQTGLPYRDMAMRVAGPAVVDLEGAFAGVWDRSGTPLPPQERPALRDAPPAGEQAVRVIIQEPGKLRILRVLELLTASVERRLWIADAYFLTVPRLTQALTAAARDGVDVRLLLPATNDLPIVGALSRASYRPFLRAGVRIWEYGGPMMHAKATVADGWWSRVGSTNLNITGLWTNWEIDIAVEDKRCAAAMEAVFEADLADAREVRLASAVRRTYVRPARLISAQERHIQRRSPEGSSRALAAVTRAGIGAFQSSGMLLSRYERRAQLVIGGGLVGFGLLAARYPRVVAWPLAVAAGGFGASLLQRATRTPERSSVARSRSARRGASSRNSTEIHP
jgi:cardiolipin synthase